MKVVAHLQDGSLIKGFFEYPKDTLDDSFVSNNHLPSRIELRLVNGGAQTVDLSLAKALFFVKTFEGRSDYKEVKFFKADPEIAGLWIRIQFHDSEVTEGIVHNSLAFVVQSGFFLKPPDPQSNNTMTYVVKKSLKDFKVMGIRSDY